MQNVMAVIVAAGMLASATAAAALTPRIPPDDGPIAPILCQQHPKLCQKMVVPADRVHVPVEDVDGTRPGNGA